MGPSARERLDDQLAFLLEADKLKEVERGNFIASGTRRETSAEHSWHVALMAIVLREHFPEPVDLSRTVMLLIAHDLVEVYAGDSQIYDAAALIDQAEREKEAAARLFSILPPDQAGAFKELWIEFESRATPEARFAKSIDSFAPTWLHWGGHASPQASELSVQDVIAHKRELVSPNPLLWDYLQEVINDSAERGVLSRS
jgi:putative hydrolase of HD superfamily